MHLRGAARPAHPLPGTPNILLVLDTGMVGGLDCGGGSGLGLGGVVRMVVGGGWWKVEVGGGDW